MPSLIDVAKCECHNDAKIVSREPLEVVTPAVQWSYAISIPARSTGSLDPSSALLITTAVDVREGRVGIGWTRAGSDAFVVEKHATPGAAGNIVLRVPIDEVPGRLMFRNVSPGGASRFIVRTLEAHVDDRRLPYPVRVEHRDVAGAAEHAEGQHVFDDDLARAINTARLEFLAGLDLPLAGKRVLDAGCGVGYHTQFYVERGCQVVGIDGRADNIAMMKNLYPTVDGYVADLQTADLGRFGVFDVVHCFGLLYHLDSPVAALRRLAAICREFLIIETMVCDSAVPVMVLVDENASANQALAGLGCRPSPGFITMALNRIGFPYVYGTDIRLRFPDFEFEWRDDLATTREGNNLRCIFLASRAPIDRPALKNLVSTA